MIVNKRKQVVIDTSIEATKKSLELVVGAIIISRFVAYVADNEERRACLDLALAKLKEHGTHNNEVSRVVCQEPTCGDTYCTKKIQHLFEDPHLNPANCPRCNTPKPGERSNAQ